MQERPPSPKQYQRALPRALESVILKAIEKDPARRFQSATAFRLALLRTGLIERRHRRAGGGSVETDRAARPARKLFRGSWIDAALAAGAAGLIYALGIFPSKPIAPAPQATQPPAVVAVARAKPAPKPRAPKVAPAKATAAMSTASSKYDSLRDAWAD